MPRTLLALGGASPLVLVPGGTCQGAVAVTNTPETVVQLTEEPPLYQK
jgi:hypothetical protein